MPTTEPFRWTKNQKSGAQSGAIGFLSSGAGVLALAPIARQLGFQLWEPDQDAEIAAAIGGVTAGISYLIGVIVNLYKNWGRPIVTTSSG